MSLCCLLSRSSEKGNQERGKLLNDLFMPFWCPLECENARSSFSRFHFPLIGHKRFFQPKIEITIQLVRTKDANTFLFENFSLDLHCFSQTCFETQWAAISALWILLTCMHTSSSCSKIEGYFPMEAGFCEMREISRLLAYFSLRLSWNIWGCFQFYAHFMKGYLHPCLWLLPAFWTIHFFSVLVWMKANLTCSCSQLNFSSLHPVIIMKILIIHQVSENWGSLFRICDIWPWLPVILKMKTNF